MGEAKAHEAVQAAVAVQDVGAGAQPQVEGVAQHDLGADLLQFVRQHGLDAAVGAHGHEDRRLDDAMVQRQAAAPGGAVGVQQFESESGHGVGALGWSASARPWAASMNMASP